MIEDLNDHINYFKKLEDTVPDNQRALVRNIGVGMEGIKAIWTLIDIGKNLKTYFKERKNERIKRESETVS